MLPSDPHAKRERSSQEVRPSWRGKTIAIAATVGGLAVLVAVACLVLTPSRLVTWSAFVTARRLAKEFAVGAARSPEKIFEFRLFTSTPKEVDIGPLAKQIAEAYGGLFQNGYFDHAYWMDQVLAAGFTPEALPSILVLMAYGEGLKQQFRNHPDALLEEALYWLRALAYSASAKEALVNLLTGDWEPVPGKVEPTGEKFGLVALLTARDPDKYGWGKDQEPESDAFWRRMASALEKKAWAAVAEHIRQPRDKVRAGALLLLCHHPDRALFEAEARFALRDPAEIVRIAAAGTLAYHRLGGGEDVLIAGLKHERWEVRWWCGKSLSYLGGERVKAALLSHGEQETDPWVQQEVSKMVKAVE